MKLEIFTTPIFILIYTTIISSGLVHVEVCKVVNGNEFIFVNKDEAFIINCLRSFPNKIRAIRIDSGNLKTITNVLGAKPIFTGLKSLSISNCQLENVSLNIPSIRDLQYLNLAGNKINSFDLGLRSRLRYLNMSNNRLTKITLDLVAAYYLMVLDLSFNSLESIQIDSSRLTMVNLSRGFARYIPERTMLANSIHIRSIMESLDLSHNNLRDVKFLQMDGRLKRLSLENNYFTDLSAFQVLPFSTNIYLANNPLLCSMNLTTEWLDLAKQNIKFDDNLKCSFANSTNRHSVSEYGLMFSNENDILRAAWDATLLKTHVLFGSVKLSMVTYPHRLRLYWTNSNLSFDNLLVFQSKNGDELYSTNLTFAEKENPMDIYFYGMCDIADVCLFGRVDNVTVRGRERVKIRLQCQNISQYCSANIDLQTMRNALIIVIVVFVFYLILSMLFVSYVYYFKLRRSVEPLMNTVEMETIVRNKTKETIISYPNEARSSYILNSHKSIDNALNYYSASIGSGSTMYPNRRNSFYMVMRPTDPYSNVACANIYDKVDSHAYSDISGATDAYSSMACTDLDDKVASRAYKDLSSTTSRTIKPNEEVEEIYD